MICRGLFDHNESIASRLSIWHIADSLVLVALLLSQISLFIHKFISYHLALSYYRFSMIFAYQSLGGVHQLL